MDKVNENKSPNDQEEKELGEEIQNKENNDESVDEIQSLNKKLKECEDKNLRIHADFENIKKRMKKEKYTAVSYAHEQFARDLLPIIDALEIAANTCNKDQCDVNENLLDKVKEGINLTIEQFKKVFEKNGIELVNVEDGFDPNFHEAVMQLDSKDKKSGEILDVLQKGYKIKDRILRPAMVSIAK